MITKKRKREELQLLSDEALEAYLNREDFQYDLNGDALYRQYKDRYTDLGKKAMQDTMGQAAALTGGYGSSYAQNVGQQAYNSYLQQLGDVVPELYQLAYDRYQDKGDQLYKTYQSWAQLEQQAAQQEQWEREYELEERKLKQQNQNSQTQTGTTQPDYGYHQNSGQHTQSRETAAEPEYDNRKVSEGNIKTMQRVLGLEETGKWTEQDRIGAGNRSADDAWKDYQQGKLQNYKSKGLGLSIGNIKTMERVLGLEEDGYWDEEDKKAAGGLSQYAAWKDYQQGKLQSRSKSGMSVDAWAELKKKQPQSSGAINTKQTTPAVQNFIAGTVTEDQAAERGVNSTEWHSMSSDEIAAERDARAVYKDDYNIVFDLSRSIMPYDWDSANYYGYSKDNFDEVESKRKYIEEKYGVDLHYDIYDNVNIYNKLLDELSSASGDIAYTTKDGQNVTLQMLYDWKLAEEDLANCLAAYSKNPDWEEKSKGIDVSSDPDRKNDYELISRLSRMNVAYEKEYALADGLSEEEWNEIDQARRYIGEKYGVDLYADPYDNVYIYNELMGMLDDYSVEGGEFTQQFLGESIGNGSFKNMRHLTEDEQAVLYYIFNTQGRDAALQWHNSRMNIYQARANGVLTEEMSNWGKKDPFWSSVGSVTLSLGSGVEQIGDWISGDNNNTMARAKSAIRSGVSETTDIMIGNWDVFDFVYNIAMNVADMMVASRLPGKTGSVLSVLSVAAQATNDALDRGMSQKEVFWNGLMAGVFEGIFEMWSVGDFRALKNVASSHAKDIAWNTAKSMLDNVSDAMLKNVANIAYDAIVNGDFSQYETKVRQYVLNGIPEAEAKKKAALELGSQIAEAVVSSLFEGLIEN